MNSSYLGISASDLTRRGGIHTAREIAGQPDLWSAVWDALQQSYGSIRLFIDDFIARRECDIILTGAGTSAFIGEILAGWLDGTTGLRFRAAATTDIVTHPHLVLNRTRPTLLVSFARSGNSPESVATMELANQLCRNVAHLVITCNPEGQLVKRISSNNGVSFLLPPEADDKSLAMTGSFTSMLLAGLLISRIDKIQEQERPHSQREVQPCDIGAGYGEVVRPPVLSPGISLFSCLLSETSF